MYHALAIRSAANKPTGAKLALKPGLRLEYTITSDAAHGTGAVWLHQHGEGEDHSTDGEKPVYEVRMAQRRATTKGSSARFDPHV